MNVTQKEINKIIIAGRTLFLVMALMAGFFNFSFVPAAQADCNYTVKSFDVEPRSVSFSGSVTFTTSIALADPTTQNKSCVDNGSDTPNEVFVQYFVTSTNGPSDQAFFGLNNISNPILLAVSNGQAQDSRAYYLNNFFTSSGNAVNGTTVTFPQNANFFVKVFSASYSNQQPGNFSPDSNVTTSGAISVGINGPSTTGTGVSCTKDSDCANVNSSNGNGYICTTVGMPGQCVEDAELAAGAHCNPNQTNDDCANGLTCNPGSSTCTSSTNAGNNPTGAGNNPSSNPPATNPCATNGSTAPGVQGCLYNPLPSGNLTQIFLWIVEGFLGIIGAWAIMFIIVGGFRMVMAAGNEEQYSAAKKTIIWAVLGLVIALLSFSIIAIVENVLQANVQNFPTS